MYKFIKILFQAGLSKRKQLQKAEAVAEGTIIKKEKKKKKKDKKRTSFSHIKPRSKNIKERMIMYGL